MRRTIHIQWVLLLLLALGINACHKSGKQETGYHQTASVSQETFSDTLSLPIEVKAKFVTLRDGLPSNVVTFMLQDKRDLCGSALIMAWRDMMVIKCCFTHKIVLA